MSCSISPNLSLIFKLIIVVLVQSLRNINSKEMRALSSAVDLTMSQPTPGPLQENCNLEDWREGLLCISETTTKPVFMHTAENHPHQHSSISLSEQEIQGFCCLPQLSDKFYFPPLARSMSLFSRPVSRNTASFGIAPDF